MTNVRECEVRGLRGRDQRHGGRISSFGFREIAALLERLGFEKAGQVSIRRIGALANLRQDLHAFDVVAQQ
jgi:hypothetical protein